jgi:competence protein ComEC
MRPLVAAFLAFLAGLLPALRFGPPPTPLLFVSLSSIAIAAFFARGTPRRSRHTLAQAALLGSFGFVGAALGAAGRSAIEADCRTWMEDGSAVSVRGVLAASSIPLAGDSSRSIPLLPLLADEVRVGTLGVPGCGGEIRIRFTSPSQPILAGTELQIAGRWTRFSDPVVASAWPRDPRNRGYIAVDALAIARPPRLDQHPLLTLRGRTELQLRRLFPRHEALAQALLLGRREYMDPALREQFARAGLAHLLAISGMHVGLIAGVLLLAGRSLPISRRRVAWVVIGCITVYLAMIGAPASAMRAGIMISLALLGIVLQRPFAALPIVVTAAFAILFHRPAAVLEAGFQMSFAGVVGILALRGVALKQLPARWRHHKIVRPLFESLVVSTAAFLGTAPVVAYHFGTVAPVAIAANLPAIPLMSLGLVGVVGAAVTAPVLAPVAHLLADGAGVALDLLIRVAGVAAEVPYGHATVARPRGWMVAAGVVALLLALDAAGRMRQWVRWTGAGLVTAAVLLVWPLVAAGRGSGLEIHFLDVGQGDATAIRTPAGRWLLVDAGPRTDRFDAGERRVLPFLRAQGVTRVEAVILTHPDADHIGGLPAVLRGIEVGRLIEPGLPVGKPLYLETLRVAEEQGVRWSAARSGRVLRMDGVVFTLLWPDAETVDAAPDANEISSVVQVRYKGFSALITGDVSAGVEQQLATKHGRALQAQILKAGHHGSRTSTSTELLDAVQPEVVVISAGRRNRYGHPSPEVLRRLEERGITVARTDREGTVSVRVDEAGAPAWRRVSP